ncbi:MAG: glycosyltransferase family 4 protein [Solirubrobacterales bacterium]
MRSSPLRVALVAASPDILGGHAVQATALARGLASEGCVVRLVPINPRFPRALAWARGVPGLRTLLNQAIYLPSLVALRDADVVHVFCAAYWSFLLGPVPALLAARACGKPVVLHYHSGEAEDHLEHWGLGVHPWLRRASCLVVPSGYLQEVFGRYGYAARVIPNVIDLATFRFRLRRRLRPRLVSVRNLEKHYGVDTILRAFALVRAQWPDATLTVAGQGSQAEPLRRLAADLGASGVEFVGRVEPERMPEVLDSAHIMLNASFIDNQPVTLLEAMAAGLPVVTSPAGDIPSLVRDGRTGRLVPARDPAAMARAVGDLLAHPVATAVIAQRARREVERYTWDGVGRAWMDQYAQATSSAREAA